MYVYRNGIQTTGSKIMGKQPNGSNTRKAFPENGIESQWGRDYTDHSKWLYGRRQQQSVKGRCLSSCLSRFSVPPFLQNLYNFLFYIPFICSSFPKLPKN